MVDQTESVLHWDSQVIPTSCEPNWHEVTEQNHMILDNQVSDFCATKFQRFSMPAEMAFLGKAGFLIG